MKSAQSNLQLVRFHKENLGILKPAHPAYLNISDRVIPMLDHIIFTFVYVETLRSMHGRNGYNAGGISGGGAFA